MRDRELRRACEGRLRALALPKRFDLGMLCAALASQRDQPIYLRAASLPRPLYGIWLAEDDCDYILYEKATSPTHQHQIVLHELSHLICGHRASVHTDNTAGTLLDVSRSRTEGQILLRTTYSDEDEREAEFLATLLLAQMTMATLDSDAELARQLEASFGADRP